MAKLLPHSMTRTGGAWAVKVLKPQALADPTCTLQLFPLWPESWADGWWYKTVSVVPFRSAKPADVAQLLKNWAMMSPTMHRAVQSPTPPQCCQGPALPQAPGISLPMAPRF